MSSKVKDNEAESEKLEDILRSIRGIIDNHNHPVNAVLNKEEGANLDESVLELTTEFKGYDHAESDVISKSTADKFLTTVKDFANKLGDTNLNSQENKVDITITNLIKPMLKEWLDNNLPRLVEKIITEELKRLVPKK